jgi:glycerol-3-phosphate acyltransferase PlsY
MAEFLLAGVLGYLVGAVPAGVVVCWALQSVDVRECGSGHTGGLNVSRVAGVWAGALTVLADTLLGAVAVAGATLLVDSPWAAALAGLMAVVGHDWSVYIGLRGGIGLSTLAGALLGLSPLSALRTAIPLLLLWLILVRLLRIHRARATILTMLTLGPLLWVWGSPSQAILSGGLGAMVIILKTLPDWGRQYV